MKTFLATMLCIVVSQASWGQLTVKTAEYGSKDGYIDRAVLVVEPHGGYVEQSLYLTYADHNQYPGSSQVEIVHRFHLPANAVVNDLWLWIGDSVMQAIMLNTWQARSIYDSITSSLHDPAFLAKTGDMYDLHIFPLVSGGTRKIKLNFIAPTRWVGTNCSAELPLWMLLGNNAPKKPLRVLFRVVEPVWGTPAIKPLSSVKFAALKDTNGYRFSSAEIPDISGLSSLTLTYSTEFDEGVFFASSEKRGEGSFFQFGFDPGTIFPIMPDSSAHRVLIGMDLSGVHHKNFPELIPKVQQAMIAAAKPNDSIALLIAGAGEIRNVSAGWMPGRPDSIRATTNRFAESDWGKAVGQSKLLHALLTDEYASDCWWFPGLANLATYAEYKTILVALQDWRKADVIASYALGWEHRWLMDSNPDRWFILSAVDSFLVRGGRFLTYFDYNRNGKEILASQYIKQLNAPQITERSTTLFRDPTGNIGMNLPESFSHNQFVYLEYSPDPEVKVEVRDIDGRPVIISKRIGNGLLVVSSLWSFRIDGGLRAQIYTPVFGLNAAGESQLLTGLLHSMKSFHAASAVDKAIVFSNTDSLFRETDARAWAASYVTGYRTPVPSFTTINLLDGSTYTPPAISVDQVQYYGAGYLMKTVADATRGRHFETHLYPWSTMCSLLNPYRLPRMDSLSITATVDGGAGQLKEIREVDPVPSDPNKARFFIGATSLADWIKFDVTAAFDDTIGMKSLRFNRALTHDSTRMDPIVPAMLANEHLRDMFKQKVRDTAAIVSLAMRYRLLCDYTAFLALEPNDTLHFMRDPFDETGLLDAELADAIIGGDSILFLVAPNPFSARTGIAVRFARPARISIAVYDILGKLVRTLADEESAQGTLRYRWDGMDSRNALVRSGTYFLRLIALDTRTGAVRSQVRKLIFLR